MNVAPAGAQRGGRWVPLVLRRRRGAGLGRGGARPLAAGDRRHGAAAGAAHARRSQGAAADRPAPRALLRRGLVGRRGANRRPACRARATRRASRPTRATSTSSRSTTTITRAGTSTSALHPQTLIVYGQDGRLLDPAFGAPARVYSPVKLGYKSTKYLTRILFLADRKRRLLERPGLRVVRRRVARVRRASSLRAERRRFADYCLVNVCSSFASSLLTLTIWVAVAV